MPGLIMPWAAGMLSGGGAAGVTLHNFAASASTASISGTGPHTSGAMSMGAAPTGSKRRFIFGVGMSYGTDGNSSGFTVYVDGGSGHSDPTAKNGSNVFVACNITEATVEKVSGTTSTAGFGFDKSGADGLGVIWGLYAVLTGADGISITAADNTRSSSGATLTRTATSCVPGEMLIAVGACYNATGMTTTASGWTLDRETSQEGCHHIMAHIEIPSAGDYSITINGASDEASQLSLLRLTPA